MMTPRSEELRRRIRNGIDPATNAWLYRATVEEIYRLERAAEEEKEREGLTE